MTATPTLVSAELYQYLVDHSSHESAVLKELRKQTLQLPGGQMMASIEQAQFIALLVKLMGAKYIVEIGTFTGYTTLAMGCALGPQGKIITCDINAEAPQIGQRFWQQADVADKIELAISPGLTLLDELILQGEAGKVDLAVIDADKRNNQNYYEKLITLVRPGGLIIIDNVLWRGRVIDKVSPEDDKRTVAIQQFNHYVAKDDRVEVSIVPLGDGLSLARVI